MEIEEFHLQLTQLSKKFSFKALILFGSRANNTHTSTSDFDLAYLIDDELSSELKLKLLEELEEIFHTSSFDIIDINRSNNLVLVDQILRNGIVLYEYKKGYVTLKKWDGWCMLQETKPFRTKKRDLMRKKLSKNIQHTNV